MINLASTQQLSLLFFGGKVTEVIKEPEIDANGNFIVYKTGLKVGQVKLKNTIKQRVIKGFGLKPLVEWKNKKEGCYSTNEEVLELLAKNKTHKAGLIAAKILKLRGLQKELNTYYDGVEEVINADTGCVHASFIHVQTDTTRLSCKKPNIQNVPSGQVKKHFVSRYKDGQLVSLDYSQLEVVIQAGISNDPIYIRDVESGVDLHCKRLAKKEKRSYEDVIRLCKEVQDPIWIKKRSDIKAFTFQRAFGAGAAHIADKTGMPVDEVKDLIEAEETLYSGLKDFTDKRIKFVNDSGKNKSIGWYQNHITKCKYYFKKSEFRGEETFRPTQIKNFEVQGTAANIVLIMLGKLFRYAIQNRDKFLLINTVHDSVIFDVKEGNIKVINQCKDILSAGKLMIKQIFNYNWPLEFKLEMKSGFNWEECS